jgi:hypothetical protein
VIRIPAGATFYLLSRLTHMSVREGDHGYRNWIGLGDKRSSVVITLDGQVVRRCVAADARAGFVDYCADHNGSMVLNKFKDAPVYHRLYGRVEITC